ncbi:MAG: nitrophenyl compound nitroreductase subunit ArsF family protein [Bacteroidota bacterium]|nr:nitrophenyl compound nitroreductase subunit ArsF family protein [Bacteroidota bacterium]
MKRKFLISVILTCLFTSGLMAQHPSKTLEILYFHATRRCPTCLAIEQNTRKTLDTYFSDQLKTGTIKLKVINVDEGKNKALAERYEATGSALILARFTNGKESKNDLTDFAFSYARNNPEKFIKELKDKINKLLK